MTTNKKKKKRDRKSKREKTLTNVSLKTESNVDEIIPRVLPLDIVDGKKEEKVSELSCINLDEDQWELV